MSGLLTSDKGWWAPSNWLEWCSIVSSTHCKTSQPSNWLMYESLRTFRTLQPGNDNGNKLPTHFLPEEISQYFDFNKKEPDIWIDFNENLSFSFKYLAWFDQSTVISLLYLIPLLGQDVVRSTSVSGSPGNFPVCLTCIFSNPLNQGTGKGVNLDWYLAPLSLSLAKDATT